MVSCAFLMDWIILSFIFSGDTHCQNRQNLVLYVQRNFLVAEQIPLADNRMNHFNIFFGFKSKRMFFMRLLYLSFSFVLAGLWRSSCQADSYIPARSGDL